MSALRELIDDAERLVYTQGYVFRIRRVLPSHLARAGHAEMMGAPAARKAFADFMELRARLVRGRNPPTAEEIAEKESRLQEQLERNPEAIEGIGKRQDAYFIAGVTHVGTIRDPELRAVLDQVDGFQDISRSLANLRTAKPPADQPPDVIKAITDWWAKLIPALEAVEAKPLTAVQWVTDYAKENDETGHIHIARISEPARIAVSGTIQGLSHEGAAQVAASFRSES